MGLIDLHCHSTASDGAHRPAELVELAGEAGVEVLALTDHDTMAGCAELVAAAEGTSLRVIEGLELSARYEGPGVMHILVYGADPADPGLRGLLARMAVGRLERGPMIVARLAERCGIEIPWPEVVAVSAGGVTGKAHIGEVLVAHGHATDVEDAFRRLLSWGRPAYVSRPKEPPEVCLAIAAAAGGVTVLAHPLMMERRFREHFGDQDPEVGDPRRLAAERMESTISELFRCGLRGVEAYYPGQEAEQTERYLELTRRLGLIATGGSDFHGERVKPGLALGRGYGEGFEVPPELADGLLEKMDEARHARGVSRARANSEEDVR